MTRADKILQNTYIHLGLLDESDATKYNQIDRIVSALADLNSRNPINVKTTGTISERLCELAIRTVYDGYYSSLPQDWKWLGDFSIIGNPFNIIISVKSFKAKERLLVSGTGCTLTPSVGWGLFDDPREWSEDRIKSYLLRAFIAIYLPKALFDGLPVVSKKIMNINSKPFLRSLGTFMTDLEGAKNNNYIDIRKF